MDKPDRRLLRTLSRLERGAGLRLHHLGDGGPEQISGYFGAVEGDALLLERVVDGQRVTLTFPLDRVLAVTPVDTRVGWQFTWMTGIRMLIGAVMFGYLGFFIAAFFFRGGVVIGMAIGALFGLVGGAFAGRTGFTDFWYRLPPPSSDEPGWQLYLGMIGYPALGVVLGMAVSSIHPFVSVIPIVAGFWMGRRSFEAYRRHQIDRRPRRY